MNPGKPRIKDIALLAGVSIGTVDRVLHNRGEVSEKTKKKIQSIIQETHYSPNVMASALKSHRKYHLVSLLPEPTDINPYWKKHTCGMLKAISELEPFPVYLTEIRFDLESEEDFQIKTKNVVRLNPDGVLLAPIFKSQSVAFCKELTKRKIPFVFVDGYIENTGFLSYIGEDVCQSGKVAGQLTDMITDRRKDILIVNIARNLANVHHLKSRTQGFLSFFDKAGTNEGRKISISISEPSAGDIKTGMDNILEKRPDTGSIFVSGSKSYLIAGYLEKTKIRNINIIGYDLHDDNTSFLKKGMIKFLLGQRPEEQTYYGIKRLFDYLSAKKIPEKYEYLPVDIITSENIDFFIKDKR